MIDKDALGLEISGQADISAVLACESGAVGKIHPCIFPTKSVSRFIIPPSLAYKFGG